METYLRLFKRILLNNLKVIQEPSFVTYIITWRCNCRCIFCDIWKTHSDDKEELTIDEISSIFAQMRNLDVAKLTGGEAFLFKDLDKAINSIDSLSNPKIIHITSNGFLTGIIENTMLAVKSPKKIHLKISIDGVGEEHDSIRGFPGAYEKVMETIKVLVKMRESLKFQLGVNQSIVNDEHIPAYERLKQILKPYDIPIYASIGFDPENSLYSKEKIVDPKASYTLFDHFSKEGLKKIFSIIFKDAKTVVSFSEKIVNSYNLWGMYNRFVNKRNYPHPKCVALNNHLRILPNGDVPVCIYNGNIIGNLKKEHLRDLWKSQQANEQRNWIARCPGCWQNCETVVNGVYTGDIIKSFFIRELR